MLLVFLPNNILSITAESTSTSNIQVDRLLRTLPVAAQPGKWNGMFVLKMIAMTVFITVN
jgi:hypothetical protein